MADGENKFKQIIDNISASGSDICKRVIKNKFGIVTILYIKQLTDLNKLSCYVIRPLMECASDMVKHNADDFENGIICCDDCKIETDENGIVEQLFAGMSIIIFSWDVNFIVANIKKVEQKSTDSPEISYTIRGPRDCFTEHLDTNLSLIRYRIKDPSLKVQMLQAGARTKARIAVVYINDIANDKLVQDVVNRIKSIDVDGILESGELQLSLLNNHLDMFPQIGLVERSDMACGGLLEGKVVILVEGSGMALIAPKTFWEFLWSPDDSYENKYLVVMMKFVRLTALFISFTLGSLYIAIVSFNTDILPADYILTLARLRANVPFTAFVSVLLLYIFIEILREALIRVPKKIGPAIGIVGAIIVGQAAIASGIFDPLLLIITSLTLLSSFAMPDYTIMTPFLFLRFLIMALTAIFGIVGFTLGICFIFTNILSTNSFGIAYFTPVAPYNRYDFIRSIFYGKDFAPKRPNFLNTKDQTRK